MEKYKIKLESGRVIGPLDRSKIQKLIRKRKIKGSEMARAYPTGDWKLIHLYPELSDLFIGTTVAMREEITTYRPQADETVVQTEKPEKESAKIEETKSEAIEKTYVEQDSPAPEITDPTVMAEAKTDFPVELLKQNDTLPSQLHQQKTMILNRPARKALPKPREWLKVLMLSGALGYFAYETFLEEPPVRKSVALISVRPYIPPLDTKSPDAPTSQKLFLEAIQIKTASGKPAYASDCVEGYFQAARMLSKAVELDPNNLKAMALLASSYLNLIDSSAKDEATFSTISKLIELSKSKNLELPETLIAEVELSSVMRSFEAAKTRIVDYTRKKDYGLEMFLYLGWVLYQQGDYTNAQKALRQIPDDKVFTPKILYLRGLIAEELGSLEEAKQHYLKALTLFNQHSKSRLRLARIYLQQTEGDSAFKELEQVLSNKKNLDPMQVAEALYLRAKLFKGKGDLNRALADAETAVKLAPDEADYRVELYSLWYQAGEKSSKIQKIAKMYYYLGQGELLAKTKQWEDAKIQFIKARSEYNQSALPLMRIGDVSLKQNDLVNAVESYKKATAIEPKSKTIWAKYIQGLIESYEWDQARKAIETFEKLPVSDSEADKLVGDLYFKQQMYNEALSYYRRAMSRDSIQSDVYYSYARALVKLGQFEEAPFFFALARRGNPDFFEAAIGGAMAVAEKESIDRGIEMLEEEAKQYPRPRAELLVGAAELTLRKAEKDKALALLERAKAIDPDYSQTYRVLGLYYLSRESDQKNALEQALEAFRSYSDHNPSDPTGYIERFKIYLRKQNYSAASEQLDRIFSMYKKYPNLHFYRGELYGEMGNEKRAIEEYQEELKNHPSNVSAMIGLGKQYIKLNGVNEALTQFSSAMRISPQFAEPKQLAGYANYLLKNYEGAIVLYKAAIALDPGSPIIYKRLGQAYLATGDRPSASQAFRKYLEVAPDAPDKAEIERFL